MIPSVDVDFFDDFTTGGTTVTGDDGGSAMPA